MEAKAFVEDATEEEQKTSYHVVEGFMEKGLGIEKSIQLYDELSDEYEKQLFVARYCGPQEAARTMAELYPTNRDKVRILDAACGTGLVGHELYKLGFRMMDGVDAAQKMLDVAKRKNLYQRLICEYLGENKLDIKDRVYDAVTMSGAVGENHLPSSAFEELVSVIKPGGVFVNVTRTENYQKVDDYRERALPLFKKMQEEGKWNLEKEEVISEYVLGKQGVIFVYRIL